VEGILGPSGNLRDAVRSYTHPNSCLMDLMMDGSETMMKSYPRVTEVFATKVKLVYEVNWIVFCTANSLSIVIVLMRRYGDTCIHLNWSRIALSFNVLGIFRCSWATTQCEGSLKVFWQVVRWLAFNLFLVSVSCTWKI
jgi:hypothetical protein